MSIAMKPRGWVGKGFRGGRCGVCGVVESSAPDGDRTCVSRVLPVVADEEPIVLWFLCPRCLGMKETQP